MHSGYQKGETFIQLWIVNFCRRSLIKMLKWFSKRALGARQGKSLPRGNLPGDVKVA